MYSFTRNILGAFLLVGVSLIALNVTAAPVIKSNDLSTQAFENQLQESVKRLKGEDAALDTEQALNFLQSAETNTNLKFRNQALLWLGRAYRDGLAGTPKDVRRSFGYFEQAAGKEGGDPMARYELARAYYQGSGTDRNLIAAFMWVSLSLHEESSAYKQAKELQDTVAGLLNKDQLATAQILITQMENLYLNQ